MKFEKCPLDFSFESQKKGGFYSGGRDTSKFVVTKSEKKSEVKDREDSYVMKDAAPESEVIRLKKQLIDLSELHAQESEAKRLRKQLIDSSELQAKKFEVIRLKKQMIDSSERHEVSKAMLERVREENTEEATQNAKEQLVCKRGLSCSSRLAANATLGEPSLL
jgi:hypothetical protein